MVNGHAPASPMQPETASNTILQSALQALCKKVISSMLRLPALSSAFWCLRLLEGWPGPYGYGWTPRYDMCVCNFAYRRCYFQVITPCWLLMLQPGMLSADRLMCVGMQLQAADRDGPCAQRIGGRAVSGLGQVFDDAHASLMWSASVLFDMAVLLHLSNQILLDAPASFACPCGQACDEGTAVTGAL